jgi:hypothetical protein
MKLCLRAEGVADPSIPLAVQDRRRQDTALVVYARPGEEAYCLVRRDQDGRMDLRAAGSRAGIAHGDVLGISIWTEMDGGGVLIGSLKPPVEIVVIETDANDRIICSVGNGVYSAWWPRGGAPKVILGLDARGRQVAKLDDGSWLSGPP